MPPQKNSTDSSKLYDAVDTKFIKNQKGKPKGITQLVNALVDIDKAGILFDHIVPQSKVEVYPVILYTDHSFGVDSLNFRYNRDYVNQISRLNLQHVTAKPLTFINLNTFELHENNFTNNQVNLFGNYSGLKLAINLRAKKTSFPDFMVVSITERITAKPSAPSRDLKPPDTFCFTLRFLIALSEPLLSGGTSL